MNEHYIKINKCIDSSKTYKQFESCENLISIFSDRFCDKEYEDCKQAKTLLKNLLHNLTYNKSRLM